MEDWERAKWKVSTISAFLGLVELLCWLLSNCNTPRNNCGVHGKWAFLHFTSPPPYPPHPTPIPHLPSHCDFTQKQLLCCWTVIHVLNVTFPFCEVQWDCACSDILLGLPILSSFFSTVSLRFSASLEPSLWIRQLGKSVCIKHSRWIHAHKCTRTEIGNLCCLFHSPLSLRRRLVLSSLVWGRVGHFSEEACRTASCHNLFLLRGQSCLGLSRPITVLSVTDGCQPSMAFAWMTRTAYSSITAELQDSQMARCLHCGRFISSECGVSSVLRDSL